MTRPRKVCTFAENIQHMKRQTLVLFVLLASVLSVSSQNIEMLSGNPQWWYGQYYYGKFSDAGLNTLINDDEFGFLETGGKKYHLIYQIEEAYAGHELLYLPIFPLGIREEGGKVYVLYKDYKEQVERLSDHMKSIMPIPFLQTSETELLLYDFTLQVGDRYPTSDTYEEIYVEKLEAVICDDGKSRKLFTLTNGLQILEGIGCLNSKYGDLLYYLYPSEVWRYNTDYFDNRLYICVNSGEVVYKDPSSQTMVKNIQQQNNTNGSTWYDLSGRRLSAPPARGLYIEDGKVKASHR